MKKINILVSTLAIGTLFVSCEDTRLEGIPENKVYMARSGLQTVPFYNLNRPETMQVSVVKSGYYNVAGSVTIDTVGQSEIEEYNKEFSTNIIQLPDSCYSFQKATLAIGEKDLYVTNPMTVNVPGIGQLQKENPGKVYGVPVKMLGASLSMTKGRELSIFQFDIKPAIATFSKYGEQTLALDKEKDTTFFTFDISVPFKNDWDLVCSIEESDKTFKEFNDSKGGVYSRIPAEALIGLKDEYVIPKGQQKVTVRFGVSKKAAGVGFFAFVPTMTSITPPEGANITVLPDASKDFYAAMLTTAADLDRTGWSVTSDHSDPGQGQNPEITLLDGDIATFWHSNWTTGKPSVHPAVVNNPESWASCTIVLPKVYQIVGVKITPRQVGVTTEGSFQLSEDGQTWSEDVGTFVVTTKNTWINFPIKSGKAKFIKVIAKKGYAQYAELGAQGAEVK